MGLQLWVLLGKTGINVNSCLYVLKLVSILTLYFFLNQNVMKLVYHVYNHQTLIIAEFAVFAISFEPVSIKSSETYTYTMLITTKHIPSLNLGGITVTILVLCLFKKGKKTNFLLCAELCCFITGKSSFLRTFTVVSCVYWANVSFLISKVLHKFSFLIYFKMCKHLLPGNLVSKKTKHQ